MEFILSCAAAYLIFRVLDAVFTRKPKIKAGDFFREIDGQLYILREVPSDQPQAGPTGKPVLHIVKGARS